MLWNKQKIIAALGNVSVEGDFNSSKFSIDSRTIKPGEIFIAIKGENFDGHDFIKKAVENGAVAVITEKKLDILVPLIIAENTVTAMQDLAKYAIQNSKAKIIGVTGSCGKTTTKNMLHSFLKNYGKTSSTAGNYNNSIGLPLSVLNSEPDSDFLILEMGTNHRGEIRFLSEIAQPDVALITIIGSNHIGNFGSKQEIAMEKAEIFSNQKTIAVINADDENLLSAFIKKNRIIKFGERGDVEFLGYENSTVSVEISGKIYKYHFPNYGMHFIRNSIGAIAVLHALGLEIDQDILSKTNFHPERGRGKQHRIKIFDKSIILIDDSYNASYESIIALKDYIKTFEYKKILILGDIVEMGASSFDIYLELSKELKDIDFIITVGTEIKCLNNYIKNVIFNYENVDSLIRNFREVINSIHYDDLVIGIKGSNKVGLNKIFTHLSI